MKNRDEVRKRTTERFAKAPIDRALLERQLQQFLVEMFAHDLFWDCLGLCAGWHWLVAPLRPRVQTLGRKFARRPKAFSSRLQRLSEQHLLQAKRRPGGPSGLGRACSLPQTSDRTSGPGDEVWPRGKLGGAPLHASPSPGPHRQEANDARPPAPPGARTVCRRLHRRSRPKDTEVLGRRPDIEKARP
jgi:hypothetical protein